MLDTRKKHTVCLGAYLLLWFSASGFLIHGLRGSDPIPAAATLAFCVAMIATLAMIIRENRRFPIATAQSGGSDIQLPSLGAARN
jgi:hypothetical protein